MKTQYFALLMTLVGGTATFLGGVTAVMLKPSNHLLGHMLSFATGVMLIISFTDMYAESVEKLGGFYSPIAFFCGSLFFIILTNIADDEPHEKKEDSKEKSQEKNEDSKDKSQEKNGKEDELYKIGLFTTLGMCLHNFPEGIAVYITCLNGVEKGLPLTLAMALHSIPEGISIAAPIFAATKSKTKALLFTLVTGSCELIGAVLFGIFFTHLLTPFIMQFLVAAVSGMLVTLSLMELLPTALFWLNTKQMSKSLLLGMMVTFGSIYFIEEKLKAIQQGVNHVHKEL